MVASMQRLGFSTNGNREQRKLAVDIAEVLIKWEARKKKSQQQGGADMKAEGGEQQGWEIYN